MSDVNFGDTVDEKGGTKFKKTEYLTLTSGNEYVIRILDAMETKLYAHFVGRGWLECLEEECPICQSNRKILYEHPEDFRDVDGWCPKRPRFYLNVLDKADGKVKVLSCGPRLIEDLKVMSKAIRDEEDNRIDIRKYDWSLTVRGAGRDKEVTPSHRFFGKLTDVDLQGQELYDLEECIIRLKPDEMLQVFNGATLKDVFALRRAANEVDVEKNEVNDLSSVLGSVDDIFKG